MAGTKEVMADHILKDLLKRRRNASDLINALLFKGQRRVASEDIEIIDGEDVLIELKRNRIPVSLEKRRDILIRLKKEGCLLGIENQMEADGSMAIRTGIYDMMSYLRQYHDGGDIMQVITIVLYFGEREWKKPTDIRGLISGGIHEELFNDYEGHIYDVKEIDDGLFQEKDMSSLFRGIKMLYRWDGGQELLEEMRGMQMSREIGMAIARITGCDELYEMMENKEEMDMCRGFQIYTERKINEGRAIGFNEGAVQGAEKERLASIKSLIKHLGYTLEQAMEVLDIPANEYEKYLSLISIVSSQ